MDIVGNQTMAVDMNEIIKEGDAYQIAFDQRCCLTGSPCYYLTLHGEMVSFRLSGRVVRRVMPKSDPYGDKIAETLCSEYFIHADQSSEEQDLSKLFGVLCHKLKKPVELSPTCMASGTYQGNTVHVMKVRSVHRLPNVVVRGERGLLRYARICHSDEIHLYPLVEIQATCTFIPVLVLGFIHLGPAELSLSSVQTIMGMEYEISEDPSFTLDE